MKLSLTSLALQLSSLALKYRLRNYCYDKEVK